MFWKIMLGFVVFLAVSAVGLAWYGSRSQPAQTTVEQVLPDTRFPK
jgi:hypothetical protein